MSVGTVKVNHKDPYKILALDQFADKDDCKFAYRSLVKKFHPDATGTVDTRERFELVTRAYKSLSVKLDKDAYFKNPVKTRKPFLDAAKDDIFALGKVIVEDDDSDARLWAARMLGFSGKRSAWVFLRKALYDTNTEVQLAAVQSIALLSIQQAKPELAALYARSKKENKQKLLDIVEEYADTLFSGLLEAASFDYESECAFRGKNLKRRQKLI